ncbi:NifB/NifX family molybdenum-iron cluster-binding protein [Kaarinaea lacus]
MKIAIAADTANSDAPISMNAARAPCYLVFDEDGKLLDTVSNPYSSVEKCVAPRTARFLRQHHINTLVAGDFGDRFVELLKQHHISTIVSHGPASDAIKNVIS